MEKEDELWLKKVRDKLIEYDEPVPAGSWDKLNRELHFSVKKHFIPRQIWAAAAAVLLLAVSGTGFYILHNPAGEEMHFTSTPVVNVSPDIIPVIPEKNNKTARVKPLNVAPGKSETFIARIPVKEIQQPAIMDDNGEPVLSVSVKETEQVEEKEKHVTEKESFTDKQPVAESETNNRQMARPSGKDKLHLPVAGANNSSSGNKRRWSTAMSVNSGSGAALNETNVGTPYPRSMSMSEFATIENSSTDFVDISNNGLGFENGIPFLISDGVVYDHKQPVTFGLSVRRGLTSSVSVETGLTYTYLSSDIKKHSDKEVKLGEQKLHYIGIPLRVNWSFVNTNLFNLYLTGGGAVEKCVYGKTLTETNTVKPLQFSLAGGVGAQYNITKMLGVYVEPGVAYFFDDGSSTETIRKDNKFNFNLQAGLRLTY